MDRKGAKTREFRRRRSTSATQWVEPSLHPRLSLDDCGAVTSLVTVISFTSFFLSLPKERGIIRCHLIDSPEEARVRGPALYIYTSAVTRCMRDKPVYVGMEFRCVPAPIVAAAATLQALGVGRPRCIRGCRRCADASVSELGYGVYAQRNGPIGNSIRAALSTRHGFPEMAHGRVRRARGWIGQYAHVQGNVFDRVLSLLFSFHRMSAFPIPKFVENRVN